MEQVNLLEYVSIIASLVSVIIATFAIWLSITFYKMSTLNSDSLKKASNQIDASVKKLESIFEKLYSDTFSIMKDTVTDMRKHIWHPSDLTEKTPEDNFQEKIDEIKNGFTTDLNNLIQRQLGTEKKIDTIDSELRDKVDNLIEESLHIEKEAIRKVTSDDILNAIRILNEKGIKPTLLKIAEFYNVDDRDIIGQVFDLEKNNKISWKSKTGGLPVDVELNIVQ